MSENNQEKLGGAWGSCADIPVSPEEDADICASAHAEAFQGPPAPLPQAKPALT